MDGRNPLVTGYYRRRIDAILKCAFVALRFGFKVFAVQHQGWCATGPRAHLTYRKYGQSNRCKNGKGGPWANDVYVVSGKRILSLKLIFVDYTLKRKIWIRGPFLVSRKPWKPAVHWLICVLKHRSVYVLNFSYEGNLCSYQVNMNKTAP